MRNRKKIPSGLIPFRRRLNFKKNFKILRKRLFLLRRFRKFNRFRMKFSQYFNRLGKSISNKKLLLTNLFSINNLNYLTARGKFIVKSSSSFKKFLSVRTLKKDTLLFSNQHSRKKNLFVYSRWRLRKKI